MAATTVDSVYWLVITSSASLQQTLDEALLRKMILVLAPNRPCCLGIQVQWLLCKLQVDTRHKVFFFLALLVS